MLSCFIKIFVEVNNLLKKLVILKKIFNLEFKIKIFNLEIKIKILNLEFKIKINSYVL